MPMPDWWIVYSNTNIIQSFVGKIPTKIKLKGPL